MKSIRFNSSFISTEVFKYVIYFILQMKLVASKAEYSGNFGYTSFLFLKWHYDFEEIQQSRHDLENIHHF